MIVCTGFGPFADVSYNPSWDCAQAAAELCGGVAELLPVTLDAARAQVSSAPEAALRVHFGVARRRDVVSLERFAHNWWRDLGEERACRIAEEGPAAVESALPLDDWAADLDGSAGLRWQVSHDAGLYVCNATLYWTLRRTTDAVFVHVPPVDADVAGEIGRAVGEFVALR